MHNIRNRFTSLNLLAIGFTALLIIAQFFVVLLLNNGHFTYSLDDPYIHLAVAETILQGGYGVNLREYSSPSSSPIWAFLLAPISMFEYSPLILNTFAALCVAHIVSKIIEESFNSNTAEVSKPLQFIWVAIIMVITNIPGLVMTGMEHVYQVLTVSTIFYGLVIYSKYNRVPI